MIYSSTHSNQLVATPMPFVCMLKGSDHSIPDSLDLRQGQAHAGAAAGTDATIVTIEFETV